MIVWIVILLILVVLSMLVMMCVWMWNPPASCPIPPPQPTCPLGYVCHKKQDTPPSISTSTRDYRVLDDPLYPPLNRTDRRTFETRVQPLATRQDGSQTDTYRIVGYLSCKDPTQKDAGGNSWKLLAREKNKNESEFYIIPTNNNYDVKIPITSDVLAQGQQRLRDLYTIPSQISFSSPLLNKTPYDFVELPKTSLTDAIYN